MNSHDFRQCWCNSLLPYSEVNLDQLLQTHTVALKSVHTLVIFYFYFCKYVLTVIQSSKKAHSAGNNFQNFHMINCCGQMKQTWMPQFQRLRLTQKQPCIPHKNTMPTIKQVSGCVVIWNYLSWDVATVLTIWIPL